MQILAGYYALCFQYTYYNTPINISSGLYFMESILEICNIGFAEDGQYVCVASNGTVTSNSTITVEVLESMFQLSICLHCMYIM